MRNSFINTLCSIAKDNEDIFLITADLGFGVLTKFWEAYPERFINVGICEQNMASLAAGMALEGKTVFIYSIGNFPTTRCLEQIRNDIAYHGANVKIVAVGAGFAYGALGMTHHATEDIAFMRAIPELTIFTPCDPIETIAVTELAAKTKGPCYIRLGKGGEPEILDNNSKISCLSPTLICEGNDTAIFACGGIITEAISAAKSLENKGIHCAVYSFPTIKPIDKETIINVAKQYDYLFTLEEHSIIGGFGSAVSEIIAEHSSKTILKRIGLNDVFSSSVGSQTYLRSLYKMDSKYITELILTSLK